MSGDLALWGYAAGSALISAAAAYLVVDSIAPGMAPLAAVAVLSAFLFVFLIVEDAHRRLLRSRRHD